MTLKTDLKVKLSFYVVQKAGWKIKKKERKLISFACHFHADGYVPLYLSCAERQPLKILQMTTEEERSKEVEKFFVTDNSPSQTLQVLIAFLQ